MAPFVAWVYAHQLSQPLYRLHTAYRNGPRGQEEALARLAPINPDRATIPDTSNGHCLRAVLRPIHNQHA